MPGERYRRLFRSLCSCDVFRALVNSLLPLRYSLCSCDIIPALVNSLLPLHYSLCSCDIFRALLHFLLPGHCRQSCVFKRRKTRAKPNKKQTYKNASTFLEMILPESNEKGADSERVRQGNRKTSSRPGLTAPR